MNYAIIISEQDIAGMNVKNRLLELFDFVKLDESFDNNPAYYFEKNNKITVYTTKKDSIHCEHIDKEITADVFVFATRHASATGEKCFCVHAPGNWGKAEAGGEEEKICVSCPFLMREMLLKLKDIVDLKNAGYSITPEATHHGPLISKPCLFIEIGSSAKEWHDMNAAEIIAETIMHGLTNEPCRPSKTAIVLGGRHYNQVACKLVFNLGFAVGHIYPKYFLQQLNEKLLKLVVEKNLEKVNLIILDWKGLGTEKQRVVALLDSLGLRFERYQDL